VVLASCRPTESFPCCAIDNIHGIDVVDMIFDCTAVAAAAAVAVVDVICVAVVVAIVVVVHFW